MSRARKMLRQKPRPNKVIPLRGIKIVESIRDGMPHIAIDGPGCTLDDLERLLDFARNAVANEREKSRITMPVIPKAE